MVTSARRGASNLGCLVSLLLFVAALYYGVNIGEVYVRYYRLLDEMRAQARIAPSVTDDVIQRRVVETVDELGLPEAARNVFVRRDQRRRIIVIESNYSEQVELPFFNHTFEFNPRAEEPL